MQKTSYIKDFQKWKEEFNFYTKIKVRFSETDMFGHMNNVSAFIYFEQARIEYLQYIGFSLDENGDQGIPLVADLQCDFHKQVFFNEEIRLYVKANHVGTSSIDIHYMGLNEKEDICITGRGALVYVDKTQYKPIKIPQHMVNKLIKGQK